MLTGEDIDNAQQEAYEERYNAVVERVKTDCGLSKFAFTPGPDFMEKTEDEIVTQIVESIERLKSGDLEEVEIED